MFKIVSRINKKVKVVKIKIKRILKKLRIKL